MFTETASTKDPHHHHHHHHLRWSILYSAAQRSRQSWHWGAFQQQREGWQTTSFLSMAGGHIKWLHVFGGLKERRQNYHRLRWAEAKLHQDIRVKEQRRGTFLFQGSQKWTNVICWKNRRQWQTIGCLDAGNSQPLCCIEASLSDSLSSQAASTVLADMGNKTPHSTVSLTILSFTTLFQDGPTLQRRGETAIVTILHLSPTLLLWLLKKNSILLSRSTG